ncbi:MAG: IS1380 family transposase, partial [Nitrospirae bacterium]
MIRRIVERIRAAWPQAAILRRGDSGFCREPLMAWCESNGVDYLFGLAKNARLCRIIGAELQWAKREHEKTGAPSRCFTEFTYRTKKSWSRSRRVVA